MRPEDLDGIGRAVHGGRAGPDLVDFSANTNPHVPDGVETVYARALEASRGYPPEPPTGFREAAATAVGRSPAEVIPTPGGLGAIRLAMDVTLSRGDSALVPAPSFAEYEREVRLRGATPAFVPHDAVLEADPTGHALAIVCNPNNPTGDASSDSDLRAFAARCLDAGTALLVDEAFLDFTDRPSMAGADGVIVARSLTKVFGLPGLRVGYAVAAGDLGGALGLARPPWNVGAPALAVGTHCLGETGFVEETRERVRRERGRMREALAGSFEVHPSEAPFLLLDVGDRDVDGVVSAARDRGIAVRDATTFRGLESHVRVAVRLPAENDRLCEVLAGV